MTGAFVQPSPDEVKREFARLRGFGSGTTGPAAGAEAVGSGALGAYPGAEAALAYLYDLGLKSGYIRVEDIARNICWTADSPYGELEITVNLSKPEKDPRAIAAAAACGASAGLMGEGAQCATAVGIGQPAAGGAVCPEQGGAYLPQCDICWENEGYAGDAQRAAKPHLRIAALELAGETWGLQYSPYAYFREHCIALSREHRPMKIDAACFERLLDFVDQFPMYFMGSNADLPIVGGSILSHDHFQGGRHEFALMRAPIEREFSIAGCEDVRCGVVRWPASVIRLHSTDRAQLACAAQRVLDAWRTWDDPACGVYAYTGEVSHNSLNPIARKLGEVYVMDLVLRNNRTTEESPWGLFHPDESLHYVKKENIGLIEIMGLAILPPRLEREMPGLREDAAPDVRNRVRAEVSDVFLRVLEATGVFKRDECGRQGWDRFIAALS